LTGIQWTFAGDLEPTLLFDARLPFGSSLSCKVFQAVSDAVARAFRGRGYFAISYIDDFLIVADTEYLCKQGLDCLTTLIQDLGLVVNWDKVSQPATVMTFLGVSIDCVNRTLALSSEKLADVKTALVKWHSKRKCKKVDLQSLIGSLNWCARVIRGGRTFVRNLINLMVTVKESYHYVRLSVAARSDISWWLVALDKFNGTCPFNVDIPLASFEFATDACLEGGGAFFLNDWFHAAWRVDCPELSGSNINVLELKVIELSARRWGHLWNGLHVLVRSDNVLSVAAINNTTSRSPALLEIVKNIYWLSVKHNFRLSAKHIAGELNVFSDALSRLCKPEFACLAASLLSGESGSCVYAKNHMSYPAFLLLQEEWLRVWSA
jgi:hypothetical protein